MAVLLALKRLLAPVGYDPQAAAEAEQELTPKLAALGLVCPPAAAVKAAVSLKHSIRDWSPWHAKGVARLMQDAAG